jgi:FkbM family methyltransferase
MYNLLKWYTQNFPFPFKGWKFLRAYMTRTGLVKKIFVKKIFNGSLMQLIPEDHVQQYLFWYGIYENETAKEFLKNINPSNCILDIGANVGYYSILAASKANKGKVFAFEPNINLHTQIKNSALLNKFTNIQIVPHAVSNVHNQELKLYISNADNKGMSALEIPENYSGLTETIICVTIDEWIKTANIQKVDIIKMDIEGAELKALHGMQNTLIKHKPILFIEVCNDTLKKFNSTSLQVFDYIINLGYNAYALQINGSLQLMNNYTETIDFNIVFKAK